MYGAPTTRLALICAVATLAAVVPAGASAAPWRPDVRAAKAFAAKRRGIIAFAVRTPTRSWGWHARRAYPSASLLKPILLGTYLGRRSVRHRPLRSWERALLGPMIRRSDNAAAGAVLGIVGLSGLRAFGRQARMRRFSPRLGIWGLSRIDAEDQARFFLRIDRLMPRRHRAYAMRLLASIVPSQRWGFGHAVPRGWRIYFKGGWGSGTGFVDHQSALLVRGRLRVAVSVLTLYDGSHAYGKATLRGMAVRLLRGLATARDVR